jgi:hypothetical protein
MAPVWRQTSIHPTLETRKTFREEWKTAQVQHNSEYMKFNASLDCARPRPSALLRGRARPASRISPATAPLNPSGFCRLLLARSISPWQSSPQSTQVSLFQSTWKRPWKAVGKIVHKSDESFGSERATFCTLASVRLTVSHGMTRALRF